MRHIPALDGLRALAVLAVLLLHAQVPFMRGGGVGVDVFFVLSGYLITRVLTENQPTLGEFYLRRAKRLVPPLAFMLTVYLLVMPTLRPDVAHVRDAALAFFYLSDYSYAFWKTPNYLAHTWSLSVEEHFYLLWPLVLLRWRPTVRALLVAYIVATAWRWAQSADWHAAYFRFDTRLSGLILGCLIANVKRIDIPAWPGLLVLAILVVGDNPRALDAFQHGKILAEFATALVILGRHPAWLASTPLVVLGKLSYGIYLWHYPMTRVIREAGYGPYTNFILSSAASVALAWLSYVTVEAWFRRQRVVVKVCDSST